MPTRSRGVRCTTWALVLVTPRSSRLSEQSFRVADRCGGVRRWLALALTAPNHRAVLRMDGGALATGLRQPSGRHGKPAQGVQRLAWLGATPRAGFRRLLQDPQPDGMSNTGTLDPEGQPEDGSDPSTEDPGAQAPAGDSEADAVEQESPDLLRGACTNRSELLRSAHAMHTPVSTSGTATLQVVSQPS